MSDTWQSLLLSTYNLKTLRSHSSHYIHNRIVSLLYKLTAQHLNTNLEYTKRCWRTESGRWVDGGRFESQSGWFFFITDLDKSSIEAVFKQLAIKLGNINHHQFITFSLFQPITSSSLMASAKEEDWLSAAPLNSSDEKNYGNKGRSPKPLENRLYGNLYEQKFLYQQGPTPDFLNGQNKLVRNMCILLNTENTTKLCKKSVQGCPPRP